MHILRLKQLERNIAIPKNGFCSFLLVVIHAQNIYYQLLSPGERRVILPNVRFLRHYSVPDICLEYFCALRWSLHMDYSPLQRNLISREILWIYRITLIYSKLFQCVPLARNVRNFQACHIFNSLYDTLLHISHFLSFI